MLPDFPPSILLTPMSVSPVVLVGHYIHLEPLTPAHIPQLCAIGFEPEIWRHMLYGVIDTPEKMTRHVEDLLARRDSGTDLPFVVIHTASGNVAGCTRYLNIEPRNHALEIGGTWYGVAYQRTAVNTEAKFLLLQHAFERLAAVRVQLKTDLNNHRSQLAIERIGAVREGVLRDHVVRPDGTLRSSVLYSVLRSEWPGIKSLLEGYLRY